MSRNIENTIYHLGKEVAVFTRTSSGSNAFNNPESEWNWKRNTVAVRTYPNRNTQREGPSGTYEGDNPVFLFIEGEEPPSDARIVYDDVKYEMQSPTRYNSHVSMFGKLVTE